MTDNVFLNRDRSAVVPKGSADAKWQISRKDAVKLGLLDTEDKPKQTRRVKADTNGTPQRRRTASKQGQGRGLNEDA